MRLAALIASCAFVTAASAADLSPEQKRTLDGLIVRGLADDVAWGLTEGLTTEIGARMPGTDAEARARDWSVRELKRLGFENVRIETFPMRAWTRVKEEVSIVSPFPQPLAATALGNSVATPEGGLTAEVVRFSSMADLRAAPEGSLKGKIAFVDVRMTRTQDGSGYGAIVAMRGGAAVEGAKKGAVAAIIRSIGTDNHRNPHTGAMRYADGGAPIPALALSNPDADQLSRAIARAREPVRLKIALETAVDETAESGNVIAEIPGQTDEIVLVSGHLDSWDLGTGAIDDASGVAIAAAAAKLVGDIKGKPKRTIRVVFWGAEEVGLLGAFAYGQKHKDAMAKHVLAGESDFGAGRVWRVRTRFGDGALGAPFAAALAPLGVTPGGNGDAEGSDITVLKMAGVPILELSQDGLDYFDLHHTPDDTLDKINVANLRQNVAAWAAALYIASESGADYRAPAKEEPKK